MHLFRSWFFKGVKSYIILEHFEIGESIKYIFSNYEKTNSLFLAMHSKWFQLEKCYKFLASKHSFHVEYLVFFAQYPNNIHKMLIIIFHYLSITFKVENVLIMLVFAPISINMIFIEWMPLWVVDMTNVWTIGNYVWIHFECHGTR